MKTYKPHPLIKASILGVLWLSLMFLKISGIVSWSWWIVLMPLYIPFSMLAAVMLIFMVCQVIDEIKLIQDRKARKDRLFRDIKKAEEWLKDIGRPSDVYWLSGTKKQGLKD